MKNVKIQAGEFCILVKSEDNQIMQTINAKYSDFISDKKEDFTMKLNIKDKIYDIKGVFVFFNGGINGRIDLKNNFADFTIVRDINTFHLLIQICVSYICCNHFDTKFSFQEPS